MALLPTLENYWELDEASGSRADDKGGNTLSDNNTVGSASQLGTTVASIVEANDEWLSSNTMPYRGTTGTFSVWFNLASYVSDQYYWIWGMHDDSYRFLDCAALGSASSFTLKITYRDTVGDQANQYENLASGTWYHFLMTWNATTSTFYLNNVNSGFFNNTQSITGGISTSSPTNPHTTVGSRYYDVSFQQYGGYIAKIGLWSSELGSSDRATLYGSGTPPSYPFGEGSRNPVPMGFILD